MIIYFAPNGNVTYEECPECGEPDVRLEHGRRIHTEPGQEEQDLGPAHNWDCPACSGTTAIVCYDCPLCRTE